MKAINNRIMKVKDKISEAELQLVLTTQKLSFEEEREMRRAIADFQRRSQEEQLNVETLDREVQSRFICR